MKNRLVLFFLFMVLTITSIKAQDINDVLSFNPDPHSLALGMGGVANVNSDPGDYTYNPALLGYFSQKTNFSYQTYSDVPYWEPPGNRFTTNNFTIGYNYGNVFKDMNISAGFGYRRFNIASFNNYGNRKTDVYSFGLSLDYYINLSFGMSFKKASIVYTDHYITPPDVKVNARDWGLLLSIPVLKFINPRFTIKPGSFEMVPFVNFSLGYSRSNSGDEYEYSPGFMNPLPLKTRLGYNFSFGSDIILPEIALQLLDISLMIEARDDLVYFDYPEGKHIYQSGLGDIDITENLLKWKGTEKNDICKGKSITLLETVSLMRGSVHYSTMVGFPTNGYAVSSNGLFKVLSSYTYSDNAYVKYVFNHLEFKYVNASYLIGNYYPINRTLSSLSVSVKNISL